MSRKQAKHDMDSLLLDMQWDQEVAPLASFLNLTSDKLQSMYANSAGIMKVIRSLYEFGVSRRSL